jgi:hypothetical protein
MDAQAARRAQLPQSSPQAERGGVSGRISRLANTGHLLLCRLVRTIPFGTVGERSLAGAPR